VIGRSKGKGFQGVMKKHNMHGQGARTVPRRIGAMVPLQSFYSGRIWKNMGMPGILGTSGDGANLQVMQVRESEKIILVSGACRIKRILCGGAPRD